MTNKITDFNLAKLASSENGKKTAKSSRSVKTNLSRSFVGLFVI